MTKDICAGYERAKLPDVAGIIPVGFAWNPTIDGELATRDLLAGTGPGQMDLWAYDGQHLSDAGIVLTALMIFGRVTVTIPCLWAITNSRPRT